MLKKEKKPNKVEKYIEFDHENVLGISIKIEVTFTISINFWIKIIIFVLISANGETNANINR